MVTLAIFVRILAVNFGFSGQILYVRLFLFPLFFFLCLHSLVLLEIIRGETVLKLFLIILILQPDPVRLLFDFSKRSGNFTDAGPLLAFTLNV